MSTRIRPRPAHAPGQTYAAYTPNGKKLVTVGSDNVIRVFATGSDAEPTNIDVAQEAHTCLATANAFFVAGSEDGSVVKYSLETNSLDEILLRSTLPVRDVALSPDGLWVAVASDELVVKMVNTLDMTRVLQLDEQKRPVKHVSFDVSGSHLAVSCSDGVVYIYSVTHEIPKLVKRLDGLIKTMETDSEACCRAIWHPDGRALAAPTATRSIQVVSTSDWEHHKSFQSGHYSEVTALAWSPNGAFLISAGLDRSLVLWNTLTQQVVKKFDGIREPLLTVSWHPVDNLVSYTNNDGELFIHPSFVPSEAASLLEQTLTDAPLRGALGEVSGNARREQSNGKSARQDRAQSLDSLDEILGPELGSENGGDDGDEFIEDDDGAGYAEDINGHGKRSAEQLAGPHAKRSQAVYRPWQPQIHQAFQPGSTDWRGNRRYLCLNLTGFIWTVDQGTHHTITVEFYDRAAHRDFHFTDPFLYDKACLGEHGSAFTCPASAQHGATIYYRPHETWTSRTDWRTVLPEGEEVTSLSLSTSYIVVTTSKGYVRVYTLFGVPFRIYRQKSGPAVTCTSWRDYVLTISNGPVCSGGRTSLLYTLENVKRDEVYQSDDPLPLPGDDTQLASVFFSDKGDPCIYDSTGVLCVLLHWRTTGQAKWVPLLDTTAMHRLSQGKREESYWPVAVAMDKFHCIVLKGGEKSPYFPRPLLVDFEFRVPITDGNKGSKSGKGGKRDRNSSAMDVDGDDEEDDDDERDETGRLEEAFVRQHVLLDLQDDMVQNTKATSAQKTEVSRREIEVDKVLLQLLAAECREGEDRGMKALEIVGLLRDRTGRMLEAAGKIASRFKRDLLVEKINELAERRLVGLVEEDED